MTTSNRLAPQLDPDAAARAAEFGEVAPMRNRGLAAVRDALEAAPLPPMPQMVEVENRSIEGPLGEIPLRIYRPSTASGAAAVVYFHGGGMVLGTNRSFEPLVRNLAHHSDATVVSVGYRLAPEAPPPAQFDDAYTATAWVGAHADELRIDAQRVAVAGDSAGGTLAAGVALAARDRGGPHLFAQVLMYPGVDKDLSVPSVRAMADAPMLNLADIEYMHELADGPDHPYAVPARVADLSGLPQAIVVTAEADPIRDWGERYAQRLRDAGVQTTVTRYPGVYHGFLMRSEATARGRLAVAEVGALLRAKFTNPLPF
ncbi:alpha/beta hydrolase [Mycobacterium sp. B14F4]|uniref:alpha/beta hydrolase n=1 Tax=Mycobacterium sp. B14F4 TaxID=3153565 RepID=UPI00325E0F04